MNDIKKIEKNRYNLKSKIDINNINLKSVGSGNINPAFSSPYIQFEKKILDTIKGDEYILDLCCGDGIYSFFYVNKINENGKIICVDFAENSIKIAKERAKILEVDNKIKYYIADVENLPFDNIKFDLITCVGSLSYLNIEIFLKITHNLLKNNGKLIILDSYNHNLFYKINRFIQFLLSKRSFETYKNIPNESTLKHFKNIYQNVEIEYFNIFIFLYPLLKYFYSPVKIKKTLDYLDSKFSFLSKYAFKIIITAKK